MQQQHNNICTRYTQGNRMELHSSNVQRAVLVLTYNSIPPSRDCSTLGLIAVDISAVKTSNTGGIAKRESAKNSSLRELVFRKQT